MRSDDQPLLVPPNERKTFGDRATVVAGPRVWNSLPRVIRNSVNVDSFKANFKIFLFREAFEHFY